jgi:6-pyruvoyltetrahydropterin/6-carboxytetrahydropterin synthase
MHTVSVQRELIAQHYLVGGDWGAENELHSHHYRVEVRFEGRELDRHGYLVDIVDIERALDAVVSRFRDCTLNDDPELADRNPSLERFTELFQRRLEAEIRPSGLDAMTVTIWESPTAWASFRREL